MMGHHKIQPSLSTYSGLSVNGPQERSRRWKCIWILVTFTLVAVGYLSRQVSSVFPSAVIKVQYDDKTPFDPDMNYLWSDIVPQRSLHWHQCNGGKFECARLDVPLDWLDLSDTRHVILGVIRKVAKTAEDYRGPIFLNPGGPGGSGVHFLMENADELQAIVGDNHDLISFDPRGVGVSVPRIDCWGSSHLRHDWERVKLDVLDAHPGLAFDAFADADAFSRQCENHVEANSPGLLEHLSTASHARDMLQILNKTGHAKLKYWGISYGSILGGTFAAMFPDRVERLVSDGNVDYTSWYQSDQTNFFEDTDSIMEAFFHFCHKAGPSKCGFYASLPSSIQARFFRLLESLKTRPVLIPAHANGTSPAKPELVTYSKVQLLIRTVLYKPYYKFPSLANVLAALERQDGLPYHNMVDDWEAPLKPGFCSRNGTSPHNLQDYDDNWDDAFRAITCSDGELFRGTPESFAQYAATLKNISKFAGASYTHFKLGCVGRKIRPKYRFPAPWRANTSFPILFIGNIGDNVTPLSSTRKNSQAFPGSVVLVQRSWGHASMAAPSTCTAKAIHAYFQDGTLPKEDTYCDQDYELFEEPSSLVQKNDRDDKLSQAIHELARKLEMSRGLLSI